MSAQSDRACQHCDGKGWVERYAHGGLYTLDSENNITGRVTDAKACRWCHGTGTMPTHRTGGPWATDANGDPMPGALDD